MWSFFQSSFPPSAKWYQSTSSNSTKQATHYNTPKPVTVTGLLSLEEMARSRAWPRIWSARGFPWALFPQEHLTTSPEASACPYPIEACHVILAGNARPTDVGSANGKPFFECVGSGLDAALYPLGEEIKSGRV